jgi:glycogen operon protein
LLDGRAQPTGIHRRGGDATLLLILNAQQTPVNFALPEVAQGKCWVRLVDTNTPDLQSNDAYEFHQEFVVTERSLLLFELTKKDDSQTTSAN